MTRNKKRHPNMVIVLALAFAVDALILLSLFSMEVVGLNKLTFNLTELKDKNKGKELVQKGLRDEMKKKRGRARLDKDNAENLKKQAEDRKKKELKRRFSDMKKINKDMDELEKKRLEAVANRGTAEINAAAAEKLRVQFAKIQDIADAVRSTRLDLPVVKACTFGINTFRKEMEFFLEKPTKDSQKLLLRSADRFQNEAKAPADFRTSGDKKKVDIANALVPLYGRIREFKEMVLKDFMLDDVELARYNKIELPPPLILSDEEFEELSMTEITEEFDKLEKNIAASFDAIRAAEMALKDGKSFKTAFETVAASGDTVEIEKIDLTTGNIQDVNDLNEYRKRLEDLVNMANSKFRRGATMAQQAGVMVGRSDKLGKTYVIGGGVGGTGGYGGDDLSKEWEDVVTFASRYKPGGDREYEVRPNERNNMGRNAKPARRFTPKSARGGWLFIDTWYVIGPWENDGKIDFAKSLQPDLNVDLDAVYPDGQNDRTTGKPRTLKWQFTQSDGPKVIPPDEQQRATYYAYTEVFFDEETELMVAVGSDDSARAWVNGVKVWEDMGYTPWRFDEGLVRVRFKKGINTIKVRFENGGGFCNFSFLLCPTSMVVKREQK